MTDRQTPLTAGARLDEAKAAVIALHGRGGSAADILGLVEATHRAELAWLAPQAAGGSWYPQRFTAPLAANEPWLSAALNQLDSAVRSIEAAGITRDRIALVGFSQGACLAVEYAARNARRYGALGVLSGGLIGPAGSTFQYPGDLAGTPVLLGCNNADPHIPLQRIHETADAFEGLGARVDKRIYPGMGHTINDDELVWFSQTLQELSASSPSNA
jgi:predicted esterase